jgi:CheY-like chemotaxis protein
MNHVKQAKILLADDHTIVAESLARLLAGEHQLVGIARDGSEMLQAARRLRPDVIVTDIGMPGMSGLEAMKRLKADGVCAKVIFLTMHDDAALAGEALKAGASGYVLKNCGAHVYHASNCRPGYRIARGGGTVSDRSLDPASMGRPAAGDAREDNEGGCGGPVAVAADGGEPQVRDDACAGRAEHGGIDPLRSPARHLVLTHVHMQANGLVRIFSEGRSRKFPLTPGAEYFLVFHRKCKPRAKAR